MNLFHIYLKDLNNLHGYKRSRVKRFTDKVVFQVFIISLSALLLKMLGEWLVNGWWRV